MTKEALYAELSKLGFVQHVTAEKYDVLKLNPRKVKFKCLKTTILITPEIRIYLHAGWSDGYLFRTNISGSWYDYSGFLEILKKYILIKT